MSELNRRRFLGTLAAATVAGVGAARLVIGRPLHALATGQGTVPQGPAVRPLGATQPAQPPTSIPPPAAPPALTRVALPGGGALTRLPGPGDLMALTVDDGVNSDVVRLYTEFARDSGVRLTYFVNGSYPSWTDNLALLRPLVDAGQIQLGNHTWSHPDLTTVSQSRVADEITRNHAFLQKTYGVNAAPYFRPPYGRHNPAVDAVAQDLGYKAVTMWSGSLADSTVITEDYIMKMAKQHFTGGSIVLGHLNHLPVTHVYAQLLDVIRERNLQTVTLNDVFIKPV